MWLIIWTYVDVRTHAHMHTRTLIERCNLVRSSQNSVCNLSLVIQAPNCPVLRHKDWHYYCQLCPILPTVSITQSYGEEPGNWLHWQSVTRSVEKAASCYKADWLVASLPSFWAFSHHLQYANFMLQRKNAANEATDRFVKPFDAGFRGAWSASERSQLHMWAQRPTFDSLRKNFAR